MSSDSSAPPVDPATKKSNFILLIGLLVAGMGLGSLVLQSYLRKATEQINNPRLPIISRLEKDAVFTDSNGSQVHLESLKGKVLVVGYLYTRCPRGCSTITLKMANLWRKYSADAAHLQFLSFGVDTEHDTPAILKEYKDKFGITGDNWWFLTGSEDEVRGFMTKQIKFNPVQDIPEADRMSQDDRFVHDMRLALVDGEGHVRGYYEIAHPDPEAAKMFEEKLDRDIAALLKEKL